MDNFPGLDADAGELIRKCNALIGAARRLRAECARGDAAAVRDACQEIGREGLKLGEFCEAFALTSDHFVTYSDGE